MSMERRALFFLFSRVRVCLFLSLTLLLRFLSLCLGGVFHHQGKRKKQNQKIRKTKKAHTTHTSEHIPKKAHVRKVVQQKPVAVCVCVCFCMRAPYIFIYIYVYLYVTQQKITTYDLRSSHFLCICAPLNAHLYVKQLRSGRFCQ